MITLIVPCLNEKNNINLIKQNITILKHSKHIIVDGSSSDNSEKITIKVKPFGFDERFVGKKNMTSHVLELTFLSIGHARLQWKKLILRTTKPHF